MTVQTPFTNDGLILKTNKHRKQIKKIANILLYMLFCINFR